LGGLFEGRREDFDAHKTPLRVFVERGQYDLLDVRRQRGIFLAHGSRRRGHML
jgi:hypothetical protein